MQERANTAWLLKLSTQIQTMEKFVAALPRAEKVDVSAIKTELKAKYSLPYGDLVGQETQTHWIEVSADRLSALAGGDLAPEFKK